MPVKGTKKQIGASFYRWVVLRLLQRRLHPEEYGNGIRQFDPNYNSKSVKSTHADDRCNSGHPNHQKENGTVECSSDNTNREVVNDSNNDFNSSYSCLNQDNVKSENEDGFIDKHNSITSKYSSRQSSEAQLQNDSNSETDDQKDVSLQESHSSSLNKSCDDKSYVKDVKINGKLIAESENSNEVKSTRKTSMPNISEIKYERKSNKRSILKWQSSLHSSVQSLFNIPRTKHVDLSRKWDSIGVLYGSEFLVIKRKVRERLMRILQERRERENKARNCIVSKSISCAHRSKCRTSQRKTKAKKSATTHDFQNIYGKAASSIRELKDNYCSNRVIDDRTSVNYGSNSVDHSYPSSNSLPYRKVSSSDKFSDSETVRNDVTSKKTSPFSSTYTSSKTTIPSTSGSGVNTTNNGRSSTRHDPSTKTSTKSEYSHYTDRYSESVDLGHKSSLICCPCFLHFNKRKR